MSEKYFTIISGLETIRNNLLNIKEKLLKKGIGGEHNITIEFGSFLASIWFGEEITNRLTFRNQEYTLEDLLQEFSKSKKYWIIKEMIPNWDDKVANFSWIDKPLRNWEFREKIYQFYTPTFKVLSYSIEKYAWNDFIKGILNVFFRLTNYNSGSMVPIQDLVDLHTARYFSTRTLYSRGEISAHDDFQYLRHWGLAVEGILFTLQNMGVEFPAPYYPGLAVLEKKDTLYQALVDLEHSFKDLSEKKK